MNAIKTIPGYAPLKEEIDSGLLDSLYEIEEGVVLNYTLADAIREGSRHTDQAVGAYIKGENEVCALSAAAIAIEARFK